MTQGDPIRMNLPGTYCEETFSFLLTSEVEVPSLTLSLRIKPTCREQSPETDRLDSVDAELPI